MRGSNDNESGSVTVHALTDPMEKIREQVVDRLHQLETALTAHGFSVEVETTFWCLTATKPADRLGGRRSQRVQLALDGFDALEWYLVSPTEVEGIVQTDLIGPADAIAATVERIAEALVRGGGR